MIKKTFLINNSNIQKRADVFLAENTGLTRSFVKKLCDSGFFTVNGVVSKSNKCLKSGDELSFTVPDPESNGVEPENIPINIVYQDDDIAVIDKPQGMTVHAGSGIKSGTLVNALLYHLDKLSGINGVVRPGIVHRLDKNTSGLIVVAKNDKAHLSLAKQLENKTCGRIYIALLEGNVKTDSGTISTEIGRSIKDRTKMDVVSNGRHAVTNYTVVKRFEGYTLCEFKLETGRTHQIRVHAKYIGHPVVGDKEYGYKNQKFNLNGQLLHAKKLSFVHPSTGEVVSFESKIPDYFNKILNKLKPLV